MTDNEKAVMVAMAKGISWLCAGAGYKTEMREIDDALSRLTATPEPDHIVESHEMVKAPEPERKPCLGPNHDAHLIPCEYSTQPTEPLVPCCLCPDNHYPECPRSKPERKPEGGEAKP